MSSSSGWNEAVGYNKLHCVQMLGVVWWLSQRRHWIQDRDVAGRSKYTSRQCIDLSSPPWMRVNPQTWSKKVHLWPGLCLICIDGCVGLHRLCTHVGAAIFFYEPLNLSQRWLAFFSSPPSGLTPARSKAAESILTWRNVYAVQPVLKCVSILKYPET